MRVSPQAEFLESACLWSKKAERERVGEAWAPEEVIPCVFCGQPHDENRLLLPHWPPQAPENDMIISKLHF